jgi:hypothetical protein
MNTEERLNALERELHRTTSANRCLLTVIGVVIVAWLTGCVAGREKPTAMGLRARGFVLEDANGKARAGLGFFLGGSPRLTLTDEYGKTRAWLLENQNSTTLLLADPNGKERAELRVDNDGPALILKDAEGNVRAIFGVSQTRTPDGRTTKYPESSMILFGPDGKVIWLAP